MTPVENSSRLARNHFNSVRAQHLARALHPMRSTAHMC